MFQLNECVRVKTVSGMKSGVIIGRTRSNPAYYDIKVPDGSSPLLNQPAQHVSAEVVQ